MSATGSPSAFAFFDRVRGVPLGTILRRGIGATILAQFFLLITLGINTFKNIGNVISATFDGLASIATAVFGGAGTVIQSGVQAAVLSVIGPNAQFAIGPFTFAFQIFAAALGVYVGVKSLQFIFPFSLVEALGDLTGDEDEE